MCLSEICEAVLADPNLQDLSKEEVDELKNAVLEKRAIRREGMHTSHTAASLDVHHTIRALHEEVCVIWVQGV